MDKINKIIKYLKKQNNKKYDANFKINKNEYNSLTLYPHLN